MNRITSSIIPAALFLAAAVSAYLPGDALAQAAGKSTPAGIEVSPLISFRQQMKEIMRDCRNSPNHPNCIELKKRLTQQYKDLQDLCRESPSDERCGSIMREKKSPGWYVEQQCLENPHSRKCIKRRERVILKEKMKRAFCRKNPEAKRCLSAAPKTTRTGNIVEWCKVHPEKRQCKAYAERVNRLKPQVEEQQNVF